MTPGARCLLAVSVKMQNDIPLHTYAVYRGQDTLDAQTSPFDEVGYQPRHLGDDYESPSESLLHPCHLLRTAEHGKSSSLSSFSPQRDTCRGVLHGFLNVCDPVVTPSD